MAGASHRRAHRCGGPREDVVTGEVSTAPQECLESLVVLRGVETKLLPLKVDPIAGESAGRFLHVSLAVMADPEGEEFITSRDQFSLG